MTRPDWPSLSRGPLETVRASDKHCKTKPGSHSAHSHAFSPLTAYIFQLFSSPAVTQFGTFGTLCISLGPPPRSFSCESPATAASDKETLGLHTVLTVCPLSGGSFPNTVLLPASRKNLVLFSFSHHAITLSFLSYVPFAIRPFPHHISPPRRVEDRFDISTSISSFDNDFFFHYASSTAFVFSRIQQTNHPRRTPVPLPTTPKRPSFRDHCRNSTSRRATNGHQDMSRAGKLAPEVNR